MTPKDSSLERLAKDLSRAWPGASKTRLLWYFLVDPGTSAIVFLRLQGALEGHGLAIFAKLTRRHNFSKNSIDALPGAEIEGGLVIRHPAGIVIGHKVRIGKNVTLLQNVTLGQTTAIVGTDAPNPEIGDGAIVGAGAVVLGGVRVGAQARIGANAVVIRDVPAGSTAVGVPARVISIQ